MRGLFYIFKKPIFLLHICNTCNKICENLYYHSRRKDYMVKELERVLVDVVSVQIINTGERQRQAKMAVHSC